MSAEDYAVIIGIDDYSPPPFDPLQGAKNDARAFLEWVKSPDGGDVPASQVDPYVRLSTSRPRGPVISELYQLVADVMGQPRRVATESYIGRRLYLFCAGHGIADSLDEAHLVAAEASKFLIPSIPGASSANIFAAAALFKEVVLFMDCCRLALPGLKVSGGVPVSFVEDGEAAGQALRFYAFATPYSGLAREKDNTGVMHGIFSRALIEGLNGAAADGAGRITSTSLRLHLESTLGRPEIGQAPKFPSSDEIILVSGKPPVLDTVTINVGPADQLEILDGATLSMISRHSPVGHGASKSHLISLPKGKAYLFCATAQSGVKRYLPWKSDGTGESHVEF